jgi:hypothetical protein
MSGGHWQYQSFKLEERSQSAGEVWRLLAVLEHELDWGICGDTCLKCAKKRCAEALVGFFDTYCENATSAIALARDGQQNLCNECEERRIDD